MRRVNLLALMCLASVSCAALAQDRIANSSEDKNDPPGFLKAKGTGPAPAPAPAPNSNAVDKNCRCSRPGQTPPSGEAVGSSDQCSRSNVNNCIGFNR